VPFLVESGGAVSVGDVVIAEGKGHALLHIFSLLLDLLQEHGRRPLLVRFQ